MAKHHKHPHEAPDPEPEAAEPARETLPELSREPTTELSSGLQRFDAAEPAPPDITKPDESPLVNPLDVAKVHRLRVAQRLWRVKQARPEAGQVLVEAATQPEAIALCGFDPVGAKAELLKP